MSSQPASKNTFPGDKVTHLETSLGIGQHWLDALTADDPRRTKVEAMTRQFAVWARCIEPAATVDDIFGMLCRNCGELHPGLASLCRGKPLGSCWLHKGYRCMVSPLLHGVPDR